MFARMTTASLIAIALAGLSHQAMAGPVGIFDFDGRGGADTPDSSAGTAFGEPFGNAGSPLEFSEGGIGLTVRGYTGSFGSRDEKRTILDDGPPEGGLGVLSEDNSSLEQVNVAAGESLDLIFDQDVSLSAFNFNSGAHNDCPDMGGSEGMCSDFDLYVDGMSSGTFTADDSTSIGGLSGSTFTFAAVDPGASFYFGGVTATAVPVPATLGLLGTGLVGLGLVARRRRNI